MGARVSSLPLMEFLGEKSMTASFDDGRFVKLDLGKWEDGRAGWVIRAGKDQESLSLALSGEAMDALVYAFARLTGTTDGDKRWITG